MIRSRKIFGLLILSCALMLQAPQTPPSKSVLLTIHTDQPTGLAHILESQGFDVAGHDDRSRKLEVVVQHESSYDEIAALAQTFGMTASLRQSKPTQPYLISNNGIADYYDSAAAEAALREIEAAYPETAKVYDLNEWLGLPKTTDGNSLFALHISSNPGAIEDKPKLLFIGQHHARELMTHHAVIDTARDLIQSAHLPQYSQALAKSSFWFVPVVNPDGLDYVFEEDSWWRKNRSPNSDGSKGVDLNRNYGFKWGACGSHSASPDSDIYKGSAPLSEVETQAIIALNNKLRAQFLISYHSSGNEVLYPYLCGDLKEKQIYYGLRDRIAAATGFGQRLASSSGEDFEHHYAAFGSLAFLLEIGSSFQPPFATYRANVWSKIKHVLPTLLDELDSSFLTIKVQDSFDGSAVQAEIHLAEIAFVEGEKRQTDSFGSYRWLLKPGPYNVHIEAEGFSKTTVSVEVSEHGSLLEIALERSEDSDRSLVGVGAL